MITIHPKIKHLFSNMLFVLFAFNIIAFNSYGQDKIPNVVIYGDVKNYVSNAELSGVTIQLICNGAIVESKTSAANGKFKFKRVEIFQNYKVVFSGKNLVSRFVDFELKNIPNDKTYSSWDFELPMKMVAKNNFVDLSVLENMRSSVIKFNSSSGELDFNTTEIANYRKELDLLLNKARQIEVAENNNKNKYDSLMIAGATELSAGNFDNAIVNYSKALEINPKNEFIIGQIKRAIELKEQAMVDIRNMYNSIIQAADKAFSENKYDDAKRYYERAKNNFKYNEPYPVQQISICEIKLKEIKVSDSTLVLESSSPQSNSRNTNTSFAYVSKDDSYEKAQYLIRIAENNQHFYDEKNKSDANAAYSSKVEIDNNAEINFTINQNRDALRLKNINEINETKSLYALGNQIRSGKTNQNQLDTNLSNNINGLEYGIHEWKTQRTNSKNETVESVIKRLVVTEGKTDNYFMAKTKWGVAYSKNNQTISEHTWNIETGFSEIIVHE